MCTASYSRLLCRLFFLNIQSITVFGEPFLGTDTRTDTPRDRNQGFICTKGRKSEQIHLNAWGNVVGFGSYKKNMRLWETLNANCNLDIQKCKYLSLANCCLLTNVIYIKSDTQCHASPFTWIWLMTLIWSCCGFSCQVLFYFT